MTIPTLSLWEEFLNETQDQEKEYIRYLSKDIAFLKELREELKEDWEAEEMISFCIHEEALLVDACKERWLNAGKAKKESERILRAGPGNQQPRDENIAGGGNVFMDKSQVPDADS